MRKGSLSMFSPRSHPTVTNGGKGTMKGMPKEKNTVQDTDGTTEKLNLRGGGMFTNHGFDANTLRVPKGPTLYTR